MFIPSSYLVHSKQKNCSEQLFQCPSICNFTIRSKWLSILDIFTLFFHLPLPFFILNIFRYFFDPHVTLFFYYHHFNLFPQLFRDELLMFIVKFCGEKLAVPNSNGNDSVVIRSALVLHINMLPLIAFWCFFHIHLCRSLE